MLGDNLGILHIIINNPRGFFMVGFYRLANLASVARKKNCLHNIWAVPILIIYRLSNEFVMGYEIPAATKIGKSFFIDHGYGIVINKHTVIGDFCRIKHGVTIGCKTLANGTQGDSPIIGNHVDIGAGAKIIGGITVGHNVTVGAGAIITKDIPSYSVVYSEMRLIIVPQSK